MIKYLGEMTWVEAGQAARRHPALLLPLSPTEEHGPHLPLGTDWMEATAIAVRAAEMLASTGIEVVIAPTITHGVAECGRGFSGNISIRPESLENLIVDVCASLAGQGFDRIAVICMHMEPRNRQSVENAIAAVQGMRRLKIVEAFLSSRDSWGPKLKAIMETDLKHDLHAAEMETSVMLAIRPDLVREGWERLGPVLVDLHKEVLAGRIFAQIAGGDLGYFGDPSKASAEKGRAILDAWARSVADVVVDLIKG